MTKIKAIDNKSLLFLMFNFSGMELRSASDRLKNDKDVVLEAVRLDGNALCYASERLQDNEEIVNTSLLSSNFESFRYASQRLQKKFEIKMGIRGI